MKKVFKSKILKSLLGVVVFTPIISLPIARVANGNDNLQVTTSLNANTTTNSNSRVKSDATTWSTNNNTVSSTPNYAVNKMLDNSGNLQFDSTRQDVAFDPDNMTSFAALTSSTEGGEVDQITKYMMTNQSQIDKDDKTETKYAGSTQWIVKKSDLATKVGITDATKTSLSSILYSNGGTYVSKALFVILHSTDATNPGSFVFKIKWENDGGTSSNMNDKTQNAGDYKLAAYLSSTVKYNYMSLENGSNNLVQFYELKDLNTTNTSTGNFEINYIKLGLDSLTNGTTAQTGGKYTIATSVLNGKYDTASTYKPIFSYKNTSIGEYSYIVYQADTYTETNKDKFVLTMHLPYVEQSSTATSNITDTNLISNVDISTLGFNANDKVAVTTNLYGSQYIDLMFSKKQNGTETGNYGYIKIDMNSRSGTTYKATQVLNPNTTNAYIKSFTRRYSTTNQALGYYVLDSNDRAYMFDTNMQNPQLLYDFKNSAINFGNGIPRIVTTFGNASWFAQASDSTFVMFSGSTMVGQWDSLASKQTLELPAIVSLKAQSDIDPSIIYKKVKTDGQNSYDATFTNYLNGDTAYKDFLDITFQDPRLTLTPSISVEASAFVDSADKKYSVTLTFKQKLRMVDYSGNVTEQTSVQPVVLATQTYIFNNASSTLHFASEKYTSNGQQLTYGSIPQFIKNKLPSEITTDEIRNYLIVSTNLDIKDNYIRRLKINDTNGSMSISVTIPYAWIDNKLETNYSKSWDFTEGTFASNPLGNTGSVTAMDEAYLNKAENASKKSSLEAKYGAVLASSVSQEEMLNSFVSFGNAFNQESNFEGGNPVITPKDEWIVNIIPYDKEGYASIDLTIPKIANLKNVRLQFDTPKVFLKNANANANIFFSFKSNTSLTNETIIKSDVKASEVAESLTTGDSSGRDAVVENLRDFANFSDYFANYIINGTINVDATGDDNYGSLKIVLKVADESDKKLPGFSSSTLEANYIGYSKSTTLTADSVQMKTSLTGINDKLAIEVTKDELLNTYNIFDGTNQQTRDKITADSITLTPSTVNGTLLVSVTIENYVENGTIIPTKTFNVLYSGFKTSKEPNDMIVFKSFLQLQNENPNSPQSAMTPSGIIKSLESNNNLQKLQYLSNISTQLLNELSNEDITIILTANDATGILTVNATVNMNGTTVAFTSEIECYDNGTLTPVINMIQDTSNDNNLTLLRTKLPSEVTEQDVANLITFSNVSNSYLKKTTLTADDASGTLGVTVSVETSDGTQLASSSQTYTQFQTYIPINEGTQWWVVAVSTIIPIVVLSIPIIVFGIVQERKNMKRIARRLERTLDEKYHKDREMYRKRRY